MKKKLSDSNVIGLLNFWNVGYDSNRWMHWSNPESCKDICVTQSQNKDGEFKMSDRDERTDIRALKENLKQYMTRLKIKKQMFSIQFRNRDSGGKKHWKWFTNNAEWNLQVFNRRKSKTLNESKISTWVQSFVGHMVYIVYMERMCYV